MSSFSRAGISALLLSAGLGIFACAQDAANLTDDALSPGGGGDTDAAGDVGSSPADAGTPPPARDGATPPQDSATPPPPPDGGTDSEPPPPPPDSGGNTNMTPCDVSNSFVKNVYIGEYAAAVINGLSLCPCAADQCCYAAPIPACLSKFP